MNLDYSNKQVDNHRDTNINSEDFSKLSRKEQKKYYVKILSGKDNLANLDCKKFQDILKEALPEIKEMKPHKIPKLLEKIADKLIKEDKISLADLGTWSIFDTRNLNIRQRIKVQQKWLHVLGYALTRNENLLECLDVLKIDLNTIEGIKSFIDLTEEGPGFTFNSFFFNFSYSQSLQEKMSKVLEDHLTKHMQQLVDEDTSESYQTLLSIVELLVKNRKPLLVKKIFERSDFNIEDENKLKKVTELINFIILHKYSGEYVGNLFEKVSDNGKWFGISANTSQGRQVLLEISEAILKNYPLILSENLEKLGFSKETVEGQRAILEIARLVAEKHPDVFLAKIKKFQIESNPNLEFKYFIEILKTMAQQERPFCAFEMLRKFDFATMPASSFKEVVEVVKILAKNNDPALLLKWIEQFNLHKHSQGNEALLEIAGIIITLDPDLSPEELKKFSIDEKTEEGKKYLASLRHTAAKTSCMHFLSFIKNFPLPISTKKGYKEFIGLFKLGFQANIDQIQDSFEGLFSYLKENSSVEGLRIPELTKDHKDLWQKDKQEVINQTKKIAKEQPLFLLYIAPRLKSLLDQDQDQRLLMEFAEIVASSEETAYLFNEFIQLTGVRCNKENSKALIDLTSLSLKNIVTEQQYLQISQLKLVENMYNVANPLLRYSAYNQLINIASNPDSWQSFMDIRSANRSDFQVKPAVFLADLYMVSLFSLEEINDIREKVSAYAKKFKDGRLCCLFLLTIKNFLENNTLSQQDKHYLLNKVLSNKKDISGGLNLLNTITVCNFRDNFQQKIEKVCSETGMSFEAALNHLFAQNFKEYFSVSIAPDQIYDLYSKTFGSSRLNGGLLTYMNGFNDLDYKTSQMLKHQLTTFVEKVFLSEFKAWRYDKTNNLHLMEVFKDREDLESLWQENNVFSIEEVLSDPQPLTSQPTSTIQQLLLNSFRNDHFPKGMLGHLEECLAQPSENSVLLAKQTISKEMKDLISNLKKDPTFKNKQENLKFQFLALQLMNEDAQQDIHQICNILKQMIHISNKETISGLKEAQLYTDLKDWLKEIQDSNTSQLKLHTDLQAHDTDDFLDFILCGTEVSGSCQSIFGNPRLNKALGGYSNDGKNRLIAIKDKSGKIVARSILRILLVSEENQQANTSKSNLTPALFLENYYPNLIKPEIEQALINMAKRKADKMGLDLYRDLKAEELDSRVTLVSRYSPALFEYVDANKIGLVEKGKFEIKTCYKL